MGEEPFMKLYVRNNTSEIMKFEQRCARCEDLLEEGDEVILLVTEVTRWSISLDWIHRKCSMEV